MGGSEEALLSADTGYGMSATLAQVAAGLESATRSLTDTHSGGGGGAQLCAFGFDDDLLMCDPTPLNDLLAADLPGFDTPTFGGGLCNPFANGAMN